jgi:ABC-2 type transport system permease protein
MTLDVIKAELKAILKDPVVTLIVFGGVVFYSFLYPLPYSHQIPREQKITVVNLDKSQVSYQLERMVDATPQVKIVKRDATIEDAKASFLNHEVAGILVIPEYFYKDLYLGKSPTLSYAGDASFFLIYGTIVEGLANTGGTLAAKTKISRMVMEGQPLALAKKSYSATQINNKPTFNPRTGYLDYVVPGVFLLILQQTLVMAVGVMVTTQKSGKGYWNDVSVLHLMIVRCLVFIGIYYILALYYFGGALSLHGIPTIGKASEILTLLFPFFATCCFIGICLGAWIPRRELVMIVVLFSSMPLVFSAGFIWPVEAIPSPIVWISRLFPSTPGIMGLLALTRMGAQWNQISQQWILLCIQFLGWGLLAFWQWTRCNHRNPKAES